ncbi:MAG: hypothetical protein H6656_02755 [Ardenticatenaceae bacterium]|nr:hypothetical protein [Ardenticatenaceae bacterium]
MQETAIQTAKRSGSGWVIGGLTAVFITIQLIIDTIMGGEAEYFNAHATLLQLTSWLHGRSPDVPMIAGQEQLGSWALPLATAVLFGLPLLVSTLLVKTWQRLTR